MSGTKKGEQHLYLILKKIKQACLKLFYDTILEDPQRSPEVHKDT